MSSVELLSQKPNPPERPSLTADQSEWDAYVTAGKQFKLDMKEYTRIRKNDTSNRCKQNKKLKLAQSADPQPAVALQQQNSTATFDSQSSIALLQPPISSPPPPPVFFVSTCPVLCVSSKNSPALPRRPA